MAASAANGSNRGGDQTSIAFTSGGLRDYGGHQNGDDDARLLSDGTLKLTGNTWTQVELPYDVTESTVLELEFRAESLAELMAVGIETDDNWQTGPLPFKLAGSQSGTFNDDYALSSAPDGWTRVTIEVGEYFQGDIGALTFINDHDVARPDSAGLFRDVKLYERDDAFDGGPSPDDGEQGTVEFARGRLQEYGGYQNVDNDVTVLDDNTLKLAGNTWTQLQFAYDVVESTVLELEFRAESLAELHAIGIDTDGDWETGSLSFELAGSQSGATNDDYALSSAPDGWTKVTIEVGKYFQGDIEALTFINDHDVARPDSASLFREVRLYDRDGAPDGEASPPESRLVVTDEDAAVGIPLPAAKGFSFGEPSHGTLSESGGTLIYTPDADYHGQDGFHYTYLDGQGNRETVHVDLTVESRNDAPVARADALVTDGGRSGTVEVLANDGDVDGDALTLHEVGLAGHGMVRANSDGTVTYTPDDGYSGTDTFTYTVSDGHAETTAEVDVTVKPADGGGSSGDGGGKPDDGGGSSGGGDGGGSGGGGPAETEMVTEITHEASGVTYHFAKPVEAGRYWNGDIFVVNNGEDVVITRITPESDTSWDGARHRTSDGAVLQPGDHDTKEQGFDSYTRAANAPKYVDSLNVDPGNTGKALTIRHSDHPDGASLVKAISNEEVGNSTDRSSIQEYSVLTVVKEVPPEGAFRPSIVGSDKNSPYTIDDLDMGKLQDVESVPGQKDISKFLHYADATYVTWNSSDEPARALHPSKYHTGYGDYQADAMLDGFMALHSDFSEAQKLELYAAYVQIGLDFSGAIDEGHRWGSSGGHKNGNKPFVVLAGVALDDDGLKANAHPDARAFSEDEQFFYVGDEHIGVQLHEYGGNKSSNWGAVYEESDLGLPEWKLGGYFDYATPLLNAPYRGIVSNGVPVTALVMEMLGDGEGREVWANDAYFDYADRIQRVYEAEDRPISGSIMSRWDAFHDRYHDAFKSSPDWTGLPERITAFEVEARGSGFVIDLRDFAVDNGSPITRTDLRYSTDGSDWTVVEGIEDGEYVNGLEANTFYYVQARHVNDEGAAPWSTHLMPSNNEVVNFLDQIGVDTSRSKYTQSEDYREALADLFDGFGSPWIAELATEFLRSTLVTGNGGRKTFADDGAADLLALLGAEETEADSSEPPGRGIDLAADELQFIDSPELLDDPFLV